MLFCALPLLILGINAYCPEPQLCVSLKLVDQRYCYTVDSKVDGYAALGFGTQMRNSDMYVGWFNSTNGITVAQMRASGPTTPRPIQLIQPTETTKSAQISFTFCVATKMKDYIYAYEGSRPSGDVDSMNARIQFHTGGYGSFTLDLETTGSVSTTTSSGNTSGNNGSNTNTGSTGILKPVGWSLETIYFIHGLMMYLAWCVSPFAGIFIARFCKGLGHVWFRVHVMIMTLVGVLTLGAFVLVVLYRPAPHFWGDDGVEQSHTLMGLLVTIGVLAQMVLGIFCDRLFDEKRSSIPWWDRLHWWVGRLLLLMGIVNSFLGVLLMDVKFGVSVVFKVLFYVFIAIGCGLLAFGEFRYGQQNHVSGSQTTPQ